MTSALPRIDPVPYSAVPGIVAPAIANPAGASMLAMQWQLEESEWWPPALLVAQQLVQLRAVVRHATQNVPFYRDALEQAGISRIDELDGSVFLRWPRLRKGDVLEGQEALRALRYPASHGRAYEHYTTGSTGQPTCVLHTDATQFFSHALVMRDHLWQGRDFSKKYAAIRVKAERARADAWWGAVVNSAFRTGPMASLKSAEDIDEQLRWLCAEDPAYLLTYPTNLRALVVRSMETGRRPRSLEQALTFTSALPGKLRELVREAWGARLIDAYSCEEFGAIALQCPESESYHVQAENLYVEILRDDGEPCAPGEIGRVVVTALHNFAMPLIRYELGDFAEAGAACACGRGLPVLSRIVGRGRNMAVDPTGRRYWPYVPFGGWLAIAPLRGVQLVQHAPERIEMRYVMDRDLSASESQQLAEMLSGYLQYGYEFTFTRTDSLERRANEKFEDFVSLLPEDRPAG